MARRYLRCYGPSTVGHFAKWAGIAPNQAARIWQSVEGELLAVSFQGRKTWLHQRDFPSFTSQPQPEGVRLLPPHDPYLAQGDRQTILPNKSLHPRLWRSAGNPGAVLADGEIVATWRPQKKGERLVITVDPFTPISAKVRREIEAEVELLAPFRACTSAAVEFTVAD